MISLYFAGILCGILYALILKKTKYKGEPVPFVMELPNYRLPSAKSVGQLIWEKAKGFIQKAFTIIFAATLIVWFLQNFDAGLHLVSSADQSLLAKIGSIVAPLFAPLGFGDWRVSTALITGFMAKESVVSTLTVLLGGKTALLQTLFTPFTAYVFLIFTLLYTPCVAAIATVRREMGTVRAAAGMHLNAVCHCMDRCICCTWCGNDAWIIEKIFYIWLFTYCRKHSAEDVRAIFFLWATPTDNFSSPLIGTAAREAGRKS